MTHLTEAGDDEVIYPPDDLVMIVDASNCAHVLRLAHDRGVFDPTICGCHPLAGIPSDLFDTLAAPWSLLTDRHYRAWPPWPCQTCVLLVTDGLLPG